MNKKDRNRLDRLAPFDKVARARRPRYVRVYDNGGKTADRYTVVFGKKHSGWSRETGCVFSYLAMSGNPTHPQGVCQHGETRGYPADALGHGHLGRQVSFFDLPEDCRKVVLNDYADLWGLVVSDLESSTPVGTPTPQEYQAAKVSLALSFCPVIYPCRDCGWPVVKGYSCDTCGSRNPEGRQG